MTINMNDKRSLEGYWRIRGAFGPRDDLSLSIDDKVGDGFLVTMTAGWHFPNEASPTIRRVIDPWTDAIGDELVDMIRDLKTLRNPAKSIAGYVGSPAFTQPPIPLMWEPGRDLDFAVATKVGWKPMIINDKVILTADISKFSYCCEGIYTPSYDIAQALETAGACRRFLGWVRCLYEVPGAGWFYTKPEGAPTGDGGHGSRGQLTAAMAICHAIMETP